MSQWTHVNGNIRMDSMVHVGSSFGGGLTKEQHEAIKKEECKAVDDAFKDEAESVLGKIMTYDHVGLFGDDGENCLESHIPCGSEGSIEYEIVKCKRGYNIIIWGDLRDFSDKEAKEEIFPWFNKIMKHKFKNLV